MLPTVRPLVARAVGGGTRRTVRIRGRVEVVVIARTFDSAGGSLGEEVRLGLIAVCQATVMTP
jgi:hypothetical protein